jgi:hypothetical protein
VEIICSDLKAEHEELECLLADLDESRWEAKTSFLTWRIRMEKAQCFAGPPAQGPKPRERVINKT